MVLESLFFDGGYFRPKKNNSLTSVSRRTLPAQATCVSLYKALSGMASEEVLKAGSLLPVDAYSVLEV